MAMKTDNRVPGEDISERLLRLAAGALEVVATMRKGRAERHCADQLTRCSTSAGANYEEARCAESRADFVHKVLVSAKETRETRYWLALIRAARLSESTCLPHLIDEARQLVAILVASARTARLRSSTL